MAVLYYDGSQAFSVITTETSMFVFSGNTYETLLYHKVCTFHYLFLKNKSYIKEYLFLKKKIDYGEMINVSLLNWRLEDKKLLCTPSWRNTINYFEVATPVIRSNSFVDYG
jgi:hypothetical protein